MSLVSKVFITYPRELSSCGTYARGPLPDSHDSLYLACSRPNQPFWTPWYYTWKFSIELLKPRLTVFLTKKDEVNNGRTGRTKVGRFYKRNRNSLIRCYVGADISFIAHNSRIINYLNIQRVFIAPHSSLHRYTSFLQHAWWEFGQRGFSINFFDGFH